MRPRPRFVVVCGDLVHAYPWEKPAYDRQVRDFKRVMRKIDPSIPLVCLCGNHDVGNTPTRATIYSYKERFGDDYFRFWVGGVCCLVLNASLFADPSKALEEYEEQRAWFVQELQAFSRDRERTQAKHLLVFQHQPWFLEEPDEEDQYFNIPKERRMPMLEEMAKAGVRAVFAGHYHRNSYGTLGKMEMITTSAVGRPLGVDPSGFRVVKVSEDGIEHAYYSLDRLEQSDTPEFEGALSFAPGD